MPAPAPIQEDLQLFATDHAASAVYILRHAAAWLNASELLSSLHLDNTEANRRSIRAIVESLGSEIISGQKGYRHIENATPDEVRHFANWMRSQGDKMTTRANAALARKGL